MFVDWMVPSRGNNGSKIIQIKQTHTYQRGPLSSLYVSAPSLISRLESVASRIYPNSVHLGVEIESCPPSFKGELSLAKIL
jgi:hypothetical protein